MKQEIITYLSGPRNFIQGVELYAKEVISPAGRNGNDEGHSFRGTTEAGRAFRT